MPTNFTLGKVAAGGLKLNGKHNLSHSIATTADFGSVQPMFCKFMTGPSSIKGSMPVNVRVMPMPLPPFGKLGLHMYAQFVPCTDLWRCWPEFRAQKVYDGQKKFIPSVVPSLPMVGGYSIMSFFLSDPFVVWGLFELTSYSSASNKASDNITSYSYNATPIESSVIGSEEVNRCLGFTYTSYSSSDSCSINGLGSGGRVNPGNVSDANLTENTADFRFFFSYNSKKYVVLGYFSRQGRMLRKVLNVLGIQPTMNFLDVSSNVDDVNLLPLFAYYKAWFDIFQPQREIQWTSSVEYELLTYLAESGNTLQYRLNAGDSRFLASNVHTLFMDVANLYASSDPSYISVAVPNANPTSPSGSDAEISFTDTGGDLGTKGENVTSLPASNPYYETNGNLTAQGLTLVQRLSKFINARSVVGQALSKVFKVNFGTSDIGKDVESTYLGSKVCDIQLGDTVLTSNTDSSDGVHLGRAGEYAGVGYGKGDFTFSMKTSKDGYLIVLASVIPVSNYVQGSEYDAFITKPLQVPQPMWDSIGYDRLRVAEVFNQNTHDAIGGYNVVGNETFGYVPRYLGHKVHKSVMTGDFSLPSTRDKYIGYTLDNYMTQDVLLSDEESSGGVHKVKIGNPFQSDFVCGPYWRWVGKYAWMSNFDRIFYDHNMASPFNFERVFSVRTGALLPYATRSDGFLIYCDANITYRNATHSAGNSFDAGEGGYYEHE